MSQRPPLKLGDNRSFRSHYQELRAGDRIAGLLNIKPNEEDLFLDLSERGIVLFPSALAQKLSRCKCFQALVLGQWMVPNTTVVRDRHDMIRLIPRFGRNGIRRVITKQSRHNCGLGINIWDSAEQVYNQACFGSLAYPFVIQPFIEDAVDIRVIVLGHYREAYWRKNSGTFRNNIFFGGKSGPVELSSEQWRLCERIMSRGRFPYAHIDLLVTQEGATYLSEINLRGGLKGARIDHPEYQQIIKELEERFLAETT